MRLYFSLTTLSPVVISKSAATTNNHECLGHIPGSAILGLVASKLYAEQNASARNETSLNAEELWGIFHSGEVQFGPCYPEAEGEIALPTPSSWHFQKGYPAIENGVYHNENITNHACLAFQRQAVQYKQCRDGFINSTGHLGEVHFGSTTKTALDRESGKAKEGSLFSYAYLEANQTFIGWVECQDDAQKDIIRSALLGTQFIGRSRHSEFGKVRIAEVDITPPALQRSENQLVLWCLSDAECFNHNGQPTFTPALGDLIPDAEGTLHVGKSFIRSHTVRRFNAKRGGLDSQQNLISKGSVLVYDIKNLSDEQLERVATQGIGINKQQGLGWVSVNPEWANSAELGATLFEGFTLRSPETAPTDLSFSQQVSNEQPFSQQLNTQLIAWANKRCQQTSQQEADRDIVHAAMKQVIIAYRNARRFNAILHRYGAGPSASQWRRIDATLRNQIQHWDQVLFKSESAICKPTNDEFGWGIEWMDNNAMVSFAGITQQIFTQQLTSHAQRMQFIEKITRYDLSEYKQLNKCSHEYGLSTDTLERAPS
ncbi:hypothetical protein N9R79_06560 [Vibrio sp.]|nr:hypothetical protein [Vibrio sp.]